MCPPEEEENNGSTPKRPQSVAVPVRSKPTNPKDKKQKIAAED